MIIVGRVEVEEPFGVVRLHLEKLLQHFARLDNVEFLKSKKSGKRAKVSFYKTVGKRDHIVVLIVH